MADTWQRTVVTVDHSSEAPLRVQASPPPPGSGTIVGVEPAVYGAEWPPPLPVRLRAADGFRFLAWRGYVVAWCGRVDLGESRRSFSTAEGDEPPDPATSPLAEVRLRRSEGEPLRWPSGVPLLSALGDSARPLYAGGGYGLGRERVSDLCLTDDGAAWDFKERPYTVRLHDISFVRLERQAGLAVLIPQDRVRVTHG